MLEKTKNYLRILLYIILVEAILGGAGRYISFGSLSIRMCLYGVVLIIFALCIVLDKRSIIEKFNLKDSVSIVIILFWCWIIFTAFNGYIISNNNLSQIKGDITGFVSLALVFVFCYAFEGKKYNATLVKIIGISVVIQSFFIVFIHYGLELGFLNFDYINLLLQNLNLGALGKVVPNTTRIFLKSSIFLQVGFIMLLGLLMKEKLANRKRIIYIALVLVSYAIVLSFTRGFWVAALVTTIIYISYNGYRNFIKPFIIILIGVFMLIGLSCSITKNTDMIFSVIARTGIVSIDKEKVINDEAVSTTNDIAEDSSEYRVKLKEAMKKNIRENPIIGQGFGVVFTDIGQEISHSEYMFYDILVEMGMVGFILYLSIFAILIKKWIIIRKTPIINLKNGYLDELTIGLLGIAITSSFNPFLNNPIGITYLIIVVSSINVYWKEIK